METITISAAFADEIILYLQTLALQFSQAAVTNNPNISLEKPEMQQIMALTGIFGKAFSDLQKQQCPTFEPNSDKWSDEAIAAHAELKKMALAIGIPPEAFIGLE